MCTGKSIRYSVCLCLASAFLACTNPAPLTEGTLHGRIYLSTPVMDATVRMSWVDRDGKAHLWAETITDEAGEFDIFTATGFGSVLLEATGGRTVDRATGETVSFDGTLRAWLPLYHPGYPHENVVVTPLTTLATALGEQRFQRGDKEATYLDAMTTAYELMSAHVGGFDLVHTVPHDVGERVVAQDQDRVYHGLVLAALSSLAARIARASNISTRSMHTGHLLDVLIADVTDPDALFDGDGDAGPLRIGICPPPIDCPPGETCPTVCDVDANTLRADLATALAFDFLPSAQNRTGWTFEDAEPLIETMRTNPEIELFGPDAVLTIEELGGAPPVLRIVPSTMDDESRDLIQFSADAVPIHTATAAVALGDGTNCPTVYKHTSRLDDPDDNPVRWVFEVLDQRGAAIRPDGGAYRVGLRGGDWLTDWRPAVPVASVDDGVRFEAVVLRSDVPALGTAQGIFDIEFRGQDMLGAGVTMTRCWEHVPLAAPLYVSDARDVPASDPGSLHSVGIGNGLAPLLNGVPLAEGKAIMEFDIKNGTDEAVYVTLDVDQPIATYTKSWQKTNAYLFTHPAPSNCLMAGTCTLGVPPDRKTTIVQDAPGTIVNLVTGIVVTNALTGMILESCASCGPNEYRIEARESDISPRVYRVRLVVTDLEELAPMPVSDLGAPYQDVLLEPLELPVPITGYRYGRLGYCARQNDVDPTMCDEHREYGHYLALLEASFMIDSISVSARARAAAGLAAQDVPGLPIQIAQYIWGSQQIAPLPSPWPLP